MNRTNWKFGQTNINILVVGIVYQGLVFLLVYTLMPKRGNSSTQERIDLINRYIHLFGKHTIKELLADREFVGEQWLDYLNKKRICYHLRIRNNFWVIDHRIQKRIKVNYLFNRLSINESYSIRKIYYVNNQLCYLSASRVKDKKGKPELQVIISFCKAETAIESYKQRWQIEIAFRALKSGGFNITHTHLTDKKELKSY